MAVQRGEGVRMCHCSPFSLQPLPAEQMGCFSTAFGRLQREVRGVWPDCGEKNKNVTFTAGLQWCV